jgi:hypothetical protein
LVSDTMIGFISILLSQIIPEIWVRMAQKPHLSMAGISGEITATDTLFYRS